MIPEHGFASGFVWAGTGGGLVAINKGGESETIAVEQGLSSNSVYTIGQDALSRLWIGTLSGFDVLSFESPPPKPIGTASLREVRIAGQDARLTSFPVGIVHSVRAFPLRVSEDSPETMDSVLICVTRGAACGVLCYVNGAWYLFGSASGLPASGVLNTAMSPDGRLWVCGVEGGVLRSRPSVTLRGLEDSLGPGQGLYEREITEVFFEPVWRRIDGAATNSANNILWLNGRMWIATDAGLAAVEGEPVATVLHFDRSLGLGGDTVLGMAVSPTSGNLWVTQNEGLVEVDPSAGRVTRVVSKRDGLVGKEAWATSALAVDGAGTVYFATPEGLSLYHPEFDTSNPTPPLLRMREVGFHENQSGQNEVVFHYAALSFADEQRVRYRTRLLGYETDWSPETTEVRIRYTNLPAFLFSRRYTFCVTACNDAEVWAPEPLRHEFWVRPPWWLTWWVVVGYAVALIAAVYGLTTYRTLRLRRRTSALEDLVKERTGQIRSHVEELETLDQIVEAINRDVALEKVMEACLEQGLVLLPQANKGAFVSLNNDRELFEIVAVLGWDRETAAGVAFSIDEAMERYFAEPLGNGVFIVRNPQDRPGAAQGPRKDNFPFSHPTCTASSIRPQSRKSQCRPGYTSVFAQSGEPNLRHSWARIPGSYSCADPKVKHLAVSSALLSIDLTAGGKLLGFLVFDLVVGYDELSDFDLQRLARYRQHAISALDKARVVNELEQANKAKSAFLAAMSHELRTPLNSIIGFSSVLLRKLEKDITPQFWKFLNNILSSAEHLLSLINDILDLSKVEAGKMELELEEVCIPEVVTGVCRIMQGVVSQRRIQLIQDLPDELPTIIADEAKLKQVLFNLVSNAVKFSLDSTTITISAGLYSASNNSLGTAAVEIAVQDQGIGIAKEDQVSIFEEFKQLQSGHRRSFTGTGLGLALVKRFVELHGGQVTMESTLGEGSTFRVLLPIIAHQKYAGSQP